MYRLVTLLTLASFLLTVHSQPADWLRKFSISAREDGSWLWDWAWASDGSVSVVDKTPALIFPSRPASFGADLVDPLLGYVIPLSAFTAPCQPQDVRNTTHRITPDPVQGCPKLCVHGPHEPDPTESWIALVQRGGCPFVEKARQAQRLGAKAIVVGGDRENPDALLNMYSERDSSDIVIAATFIKYWDYVELLSMISSSNTTHAGLKTLSLLISTEFSAWEWYSPIITFVLILLLPSLLTFITLLVHRYRAARAAERDRAPEGIVHSFPWRVWTGAGWEKHESACPPVESLSQPESNTDVELGLQSPAPNLPSASHDDNQPAWVEEQVECAICLEIFAKGDRVRVLPCYHMFHMDEIDEWLIHKKKLCPVCKLDVTRPRVLSNLPHSPHRSDNAAHVEHEDPLPPARLVASERTPLLQENAESEYDSTNRPVSD